MSTVETVELLSVAEAAAILRVSRATAYRLVGTGAIPAHRIGGSIRINADELRPLIALPHEDAPA